MIGRNRSQLGGKLRPTHGAQLVSMHLGPQTVALRGQQDAPSLFHRERALLHEDVAETRQVRGRRGGNHLLDHLRHVVLAPRPKLRRDYVGAEEGWDDALEGARAHLPIDPEQPELLLDAESVPGLGLHRSDAQPRHAEQMVEAPGLQDRIGGRSRLGHGGGDAAARRRDLQVALPHDALLELLRPPAAEGEVGVAIHQPRDDDSAAGVLPGEPRERRGDRALRSHPADGFSFPRERGPRKRMHGLLAALLPALVEQGDVGEEGHTKSAECSVQSSECGWGLHWELCTLHPALYGAIGRSIPRSLATRIASAYPASAWRMTPLPGSAVRIRSSRRSAESLPSATITMPAWME